jgi:ATP-binding cassette, subfamily B, bacterial
MNRSPEARRSTTVTLDDFRPSGERDLRRFPALVAQAFRLVWQAARGPFLLAGALQIAAGVSVAVQLLIMRSLLDQLVVTEGVPEISGLVPELVAFGALLVVVGVAAIAQREQQRTLAEHVERYTSHQVMDVSTCVDLIEYDRPTFYDRLERARINASMRPLQIANGVIGLLGNGAAVLAVGATLLFIEPLVAALIVVGGLPTMAMNRLASRALHAHTVRQTPGDRRRSYLYLVMTRKDEAQEVRAFDSSEHLRAEYDRLYGEKIDDLKHTVRWRMLYGTIGALATAVVTVSSLVLLLLFVRTGRLGLADAAIAVGAVVIVASRLRAMVTSGGTLYEGSLFLADFVDFVEAERRRTAAPPASVTVRRTPAFERLELEGVSFRYPSRAEPSLHDISLSIRQGEVVALVGENGSGKTTLAKLLAGLYRPDQGVLRWDGVDVAQLDLAELREHVTVIFQDFARYFLDAHENISISRIRDLDDVEGVRRAAARAGADRFLSALPDGYRSLLGPAFAGGSDLSIGQWQRVALARAYFRDAAMLILDEPTAALDPRGEYEIFQQVRRLASGRTVVLISHRFSSVRAADRILVLQEGRIVEEGSHEVLLARDGLYAELFNLQAEGYREVRS